MRKKYSMHRFGCRSKRVYPTYDWRKEKQNSGSGDGSPIATRDFDDYRKTLGKDWCIVDVIVVHKNKAIRPRARVTSHGIYRHDRRVVAGSWGVYRQQPRITRCWINRRNPWNFTGSLRKIPSTIYGRNWETMTSKSHLVSLGWKFCAKTGADLNGTSGWPFQRSISSHENERSKYKVDNQKMVKR